MGAMMWVRPTNSNTLITVRLESGRTGSNGAPGTENVNPPSARRPPPPLLSISKPPSWVVKTESNVRKESIRKADPPCVVCKGSGRVDCHDCRGKGRANHVELAMLPKGEWPKWCRSCRGSGLGYCSRCLGTGEYRYIMGFQFMKKETEKLPDNQLYRALDQRSSRSFTDRLLNDDCSDSEAV